MGLTPAQARKRALERPDCWISLAPLRGMDAVPGAGVLAGVPFAVKDNIDVAGLPTTAGLPSLDAPAPRHATAVQRLVDAGAVPVGKTNLDQFATGLVGTRSPHGSPSCVFDTSRISGGSSSGSAVAVADGTVPLALGTDTAGSGRVPAAFNAIVGLKPTRGLVSTRGVLPACRSLDCVTTLTRTVADARTAFAVLCAEDHQDPFSRPMPALSPPRVAARPATVAVPAGPVDLEPQAAAAWQEAVARASRLADHVVRVDLTPFLEAARLLYEGPWISERYLAFGHLLHGEGVDPVVRSIVLDGNEPRAVALFAAQHRLAELRRLTDPVWLDADALLLPVAPNHPTFAEVAADPVGVNARLGTYTNFVNLLDLAAVAVPGPTRADGLPFGVQLIGPAFSDHGLLDLAARWTGEPSTPRPRRARAAGRLRRAPLGDATQLAARARGRSARAPDANRRGMAPLRAGRRRHGAGAPGSRRHPRRPRGRNRGGGVGARLRGARTAGHRRARAAGTRRGAAPGRHVGARLPLPRAGRARGSGRQRPRRLARLAARPSVTASRHRAARDPPGAASDDLRRRVPRGPSPLEVEAAEVAGDVEHLADEVHALRSCGTASSGARRRGVDAAHADLGGAVALGAGRHDLPGAKRAGHVAQLGRGVLPHWLGLEPA